MNRVRKAKSPTTGAGDDPIASNGTLATPRIELGIQEAFNDRVASILGSVQVKITGRTIILSGCVGSWAEHEQICRAAWTTPGVTDVETRITVWEACPSQ